jgi:7-cyano-7-deazaguanine synthase in queuosine biosynthesis
MMKEKSKRGVLLYGGGLDSTALLLELVKDHTLIALHVNYGQVAYMQERRAAQYWCGKHGAFYDTLHADLGRAYPQASIVGGKGGDMMDGRNMALISIAAMYAASRQCENVYLGFHEEPPGNNFPDASAEGLAVMQAALDVMLEHRVVLSAPFGHMSRFMIVKRAMAMDPNFLDETHTCYTNEYGGCGKCAHCIQKAGFVSQLKRV